MADLIYRIYVAHSDDHGITWQTMQEIMPRTPLGDDYNYCDSAWQLFNDDSSERKHDVVFVKQDAAAAAMYYCQGDIATPAVKINKLNRKRTFGNEL